MKVNTVILGYVKTIPEVDKAATQELRNFRVGGWIPTQKSVLNAKLLKRAHVRQ